MISNCKELDFKQLKGELGALTAIEACSDVPFPIRRIYYITEVPTNVVRGFHSHRRLEQVLLCIHGSVKIRVKNPTEECVILLDQPTKGLYIGHMVWREMFEFSSDAVLLVLASEHYTEEDYIRDYSIYLKEATFFQRERRV